MKPYHSPTRACLYRGPEVPEESPVAADLPVPHCPHLRSASSLFPTSEEDQSATFKVAVNQGLVISSKALPVAKARSVEGQSYPMSDGATTWSWAAQCSPGLVASQHLWLFCGLRFQLCSSLYRQRLPETLASSFATLNTSKLA